MKKTQLLSYSVLFLALTIGLFSCIKKDFDAPPDTSGYDPGLTVTTTIAELQAMPNNQQITEDLTIAGIVNIDDRSGNYYKKITIEDASGGIELLLDQNNLYNDYPVGRKIYVKLKGLYKGDYKGIPQLGYTPGADGSLSNVPFTLIDQFLVKANYPNTLSPDTFTLAELSNPDAAVEYINRLVVIKDVEFTDAAMNQPYAEIASISSATNRELQECGSSSKIVVRTSGYAKFQPTMTPVGNGMILAIYTRYNATPQLYIRDTSDVQFVNNRCDGTSPVPVTYLFQDGFDDMSKSTTFSVTGTQEWVQETAYGSPKPCMKMSGYAGGAVANEDWLITNPIELAGYSNYKLKFQTACKLFGGPQLETYISTDYTSGDPTAASWTLLPATYDESGSYTWTNSGEIDLNAYAGQSIRIGFKYISTASAAGTIEVDNVKVSGE